MSYKIEIIEEASTFILSLPVKMQAKIQRTINLLKLFGHELGLPHSKKIKGQKKLYELRIKIGSDICRLFYFYYKEKIYVVTSGYKKKGDKTKKSEIDKAISIMNIFLEQQNEKT